MVSARQGRQRLRAQLDQATTEISLLREELSFKDDRWNRSHRRRRPHYTPTQRMRILQLRAARGWTLGKTAEVFLFDLQTPMIWMRRLDEDGEPASIAIVGRFIRSMKSECARGLLVPMSFATMRRELHLYTIWYNTERSHMGLAG
jgi:hypothetical protein